MINFLKIFFKGRKLSKLEARIEAIRTQNIPYLDITHIQWDLISMGREVYDMHIKNPKNAKIQALYTEVRAALVVVEDIMDKHGLESLVNSPENSKL
jgi:hypothetical protein